MKKAKTPEFVVVDKGNFKEVSSRLQAKNDLVILAHPGYFSDPSDVLSGECKIYFIGSAILTEGHNHYWAEVTKNAGTERSREFFLRENPVSSDDSSWNIARGFFQKLILGGEYEFQISPLCLFSSSFDFAKDIVLYVSEEKAIESAIRYVFYWMTDLLNTQAAGKKHPKKFRFTEDHINSIVAYVMEDLRNGEVLRHNTKAGQDADAFVGL